MNTLIALSIITLWYYFIIMSVVNKEPKDKILNISYITLLSLLLTVVVSFLWLTFVNVIIFIIYYTIANWFYTDFALFVKISEYFLKRKDLTKQSQESIRFALYKIIKMELIYINKTIYWIVRLKNIAIDIILITYAIILYTMYLLYIFGIIDLFEFINNIIQN